ncbi:MAG: trigger factor, partial [Thermomicrobiaceae bacterium]|nr:trigger factor [Thermomicrobiaceae bacterium]
KTVGEESLDALKQAIRRDLLRNRALEARTEVVNEIIDKIAERLNLEIPSAMVDRQVEDDLEQLRQRLLRQGSNLDEYLRFTGKSLDELKEEMRPTAEEKIRNALILEAFSKAEEIAVTDEELEAEIDRLVAPAENQDEMRQIYGSPYFRSMIADDLASRKVSDRLIDIATEGRGAVVGEGAQALEELEAAPAAAPVEAEERVAETQEAEAAAEAAEARPSEQVDVEPAEGEEAAASEQAAAVVAGEHGREREQPSEESEEAPEA